MQNIAILEKSQATAEAQQILGAVEKQLGMIPNIFLTFANSPAVLKGYVQFSSALATGKLSAQLREQIAVATAGKNHCDYCASAHTLLGGKAGVKKEELGLNLTACSNDPKTASALKFVSEVIGTKGQIEKSSLADLEAAGFSKEEIVEIIGHIGLNIFTNYFNNIANTTIDFPLVETKTSSACC
ncbi:MAG: carboxymuconolactone decarboxylase family protein [Candidatus Obscuribacterales bacterium]|nr:carboxymuconolactone decarboxylase family protein [Candidatus Obscuribacterales bacterium]